MQNEGFAKVYMFWLIFSKHPLLHGYTKSYDFYGSIIKNYLIMIYYMNKMLSKNKHKKEKGFPRINKL